MAEAEQDEPAVPHVEPAAPEVATPNPWRLMKPNKMWPDEIRYLIRGHVKAKGEVLPPCPLCGKKSRGRWTMLCPFLAHKLGQFVVEPGVEFPPLTLVCSEHPISPTLEIRAAL